ncbi:MAG: DinB family protein [Candidatus Rokuibacteriota bacterium]
MPTREEYLTRPVGDRVARLRSTPDEVARLLDGQDDRALSPDARSWSPKEIVCHLRDVEELFLIRFQTILAVEDPPILTFGATPEALVAWGIGGEVGHPLDPDRWAEERQYSRSDGIEALRAFRRRRREVVGLLDALSPRQWQRSGIHLARGRMELSEWVASLAGHDDNHLGQLQRALDGRP